MNFLAQLTGRIYIIILYAFFMTMGAGLFIALGAFLCHSRAKAWMYIGAAAGYALAKPIRNRLAARYNLKTTQEIDKNENAGEMLRKASKLDVAGKIDDACALFEEIIRTFPDTPQARDARQMLALRSRSVKS